MGIHDHATNLLAHVRNERARMTVRRSCETSLTISSRRETDRWCLSAIVLAVSLSKRSEIFPLVSNDFDNNTNQALIASQNDPNYKAIHQATRAVFFFGTPHRGAAALDSKRLRLLLNFAKLSFTQLPKELENSLRTRSADPFSINDRFRHIAPIQNNTLIITCFYERVETATLGDLVRWLQSSVLTSLILSRLSTKTRLSSDIQMKRVLHWELITAA